MPDNVRRYRAITRAVLAQRGRACEACGGPADHVHHIIPIRQTGINDELAYEPANMLVMCSDCHSLMHPGRRTYNWEAARVHRGNALRR